MSLKTKAMLLKNSSLLSISFWIKVSRSYRPNPKTMP